MKNNYIKFSVILLISGLAIAGIHFLVHRALPETAQTPQIFFGELFVFILTWVTLMVVAFMTDQSPKNVGYTFLGLSMVKMVVTVLYLYPDLANKPDNINSFIFQFFTIYFLYLGVEAVLTFKTLNKMS